MTCDLCDRPVKARCLCENHYRQALRAERKKDPEIAHQQRRDALAKARAARTARARERLDDLAELLGYGEWPPRACARLGWSVKGAVHAAQRQGRDGITAALRPFERDGDA